MCVYVCVFLCICVYGCIYMHVYYVGVFECVCVFVYVWVSIYFHVYDTIPHLSYPILGYSKKKKPRISFDLSK